MDACDNEYWVPEHVRAWLRGLGFTLPLEDMEPHIRAWDRWMRALGDFYDYQDTDGVGRLYEVHRRSIHPAMRVCREWGSLLLNDRTMVACDSEECTAWLARFVADTGFLAAAQATVVRAFGLGTGAWALWVDAGAREVRVRHYDARMVVPLTWDAEGVTECAFVTRAFWRGRALDQVQLHLRGGIEGLLGGGTGADGSSRLADGAGEGTYRIVTACFDRDGNMVSPEGVCPVYDTGSTWPTFAIVRPAVDNTRVDFSPYGQSVFADAVDAIRAQNGLSETYRPSEMAPAILALVWDVGVKMRAILLADGTLEFNYRDGRSSDVPGAVILDAWEVDPAGYGSASARPWDDVKLSVTRVVFDGDFSEGGLANANYLFHGFENLVEVEGFEELSGATSMNQMFVSCPSLETIWADGFTSSATSGSLMFSGCGRLVGGQGYVPGQMDDHGALSYGEDGVLTDPANDQREWFRCFLYADGELVLTAATEPEAGRELVSSGRLCANARYNSVGYQPWYDHRHDVEAVEIAADMAAYDHVNTNYWFYGHQEIASVTGMGNLSGVREMQHTFNSCDGLTEIDLSGLDPSSLEDLAYTFGGCGSLVTIWADADWALPSSGVSGFQTFYQCASLVGGAGTTYASSRAGYQYMRIDGAGGAGYLTAKSS